MTELNPKKHSAIIKISPLLAEAYQDSLTAMLKREPVFVRNWTPEEKARIAEATARREAERKELLDTLAKAKGIAKKILKLHSENKCNECDGCDPGSYAESGAEWPCRTVDLIAEELRGKD